MKAVCHIYSSGSYPNGEGKDLCDPRTSALKVASEVHDLALSLSAMDCCYMVFVDSIPPWRSYAVM